MGVNVGQVAASKGGQRAVFLDGGLPLCKQGAPQRGRGKAMKTVSLNAEQVETNWWVVDLENKVLGRAATQIATVLRGKNKPSFSPHVDCGDHVIVINAEKVAVTGNKETDKTYHWHTGYVGHLRSRTLEEKRAEDPGFLITNAVKGMLPKTRLGRAQLRKLHVFVGSEHNHEAQQPQVMEI